MNNVVNLENCDEENYEEMLHCDCGCAVFLVSLVDGLVCLACDGKMVNYIMKEVPVYG